MAALEFVRVDEREESREYVNDTLKKLHTHTHTHTHTPPNTHTCAGAHTHARTHAHTLTHTQRERDPSHWGVRYRFKDGWTGG